MLILAMMRVVMMMMVAVDDDGLDLQPCFACLKILFISE